MRAISVMIVFLAHAGLERYVAGGLGVTIFFFLSGFLITSLMRSEFEKNHSVNLAHFWLRRALRIFPPFYLVLTIAVLGSLLFHVPDHLSVAAVAAQALHVTNYWSIAHSIDGQPIGTVVYWSLAVEEHFYLLFPWLFVAMSRRHLSARGQALVLWGLCVAVLLWRCLLIMEFHVPSDRTYMGSDTRVDSILFGCALAVWRNPILDRPALDERLWKWLVLPGALAVMAVTLLVRDPTFRETLRYSLQGVALTAIFTACMQWPAWLPFRFLNLRPIAFLGVLSYSLYLVHFMIIKAVWLSLPMDPLAQGLFAFALSLAVAWAIYLFVEKPCARLRKRLTD